MEKQTNKWSAQSIQHVFIEKGRKNTTEVWKLAAELLLFIRNRKNHKGPWQVPRNKAYNIQDFSKTKNHF